MSIPPDVLVVTGSRALHAPDAAARWTYEAIENAVCALPPGALVVTGDAPGPDAWALNLGMLRGLRVVVYALSGDRVVHEPPDDALRVARWTETIRPPRGDRRWPLERNRHMILAVAGAHAAGRIRARVLALFAPWSSTQDTAFTADLAERSGLPVERLTCPDVLTLRNV